MATGELLLQVRPIWLGRVARRLAKGEGVRDFFVEELGRFYDLMQQSVECGDPIWLDPLLTGWIQARTLTDLEERDASLVPFINDLLMITVETARDTLSDSDALDLVGAVLPVYIHSFEYTARQEAQDSINRISAELAKANASLERLDKSKSDFISVAAHELKTPLTLIEGYAAMMRDSMPSDFRQSQGEVFLKGIGGGARRLREIVDDMIDVSMIDNNLLAVRFQPVWLSHLFKVLETDFISLAHDRSLRLSIMPFSGFSEMTYGDGERLLQAFRNIIANAVKYTPDGGEITIDGRSLPGFVEVIISDTGIGIDPENLAVIFEKFRQVGDTSLHSSGKTKFKGGGPGLGLSITKGIVEAHGGAIWAESPGCDEKACPGSTFHILLPILAECPDPKTARLFTSLDAAETVENG